jgi:SsrA-binding protein
MKIITKNKKAFFDYTVLDRIEAGIVLTGDEVKSIKAGHVNLVGSFATAHDGELFLINAHITPYAKAFDQTKKAATTQRRKLLLHKRQINKIIGDISRKGITIVPLAVYSKNGRIKVELGIAKHKKAAGKKQALKERDIKREMGRELRGKYRK